MTHRRETIDRRITILAEIGMVMDMLKPPDGRPRNDLNECASSIWAVLVKARDEITKAELPANCLDDICDVRMVVSKKEDDINRSQEAAMARARATFGGSR